VKTFIAQHGRFALVSRVIEMILMAILVTLAAESKANRLRLDREAAETIRVRERNLPRLDDFARRIERLERKAEGKE
jgi:hypothetical protein